MYTCIYQPGSVFGVRDSGQYGKIDGGSAGRSKRFTFIHSVSSGQYFRQTTMFFDTLLKKKIWSECGVYIRKLNEIKANCGTPL